MLIKVLKTTKGAKNQNGVECQEYLANETYEIFDELAEVFISHGWGVKAIDNLEEEQSDIDVAIDEAYENLSPKEAKKKEAKLQKKYKTKQ